MGAAIMLYGAGRAPPLVPRESNPLHHARPTRRRLSRLGCHGRTGSSGGGHPAALTRQARGAGSELLLSPPALIRTAAPRPKWRRPCGGRHVVPYRNPFPSGEGRWGDPAPPSCRTAARRGRGRGGGRGGPGRPKAAAAVGDGDLLRRRQLLQPAGQGALRRRLLP